MSDINIELIKKLIKKKLTIFICEIGTCGLISNIFSIDGSQKTFKGSIIINDPPILKKIFNKKLEVMDTTSINEVASTIINEYKVDISFTTYFNNGSLLSTILIKDKFFNHQVETVNKYTAAVEAMTFFTSLIEKNL